MEELNNNDIQLDGLTEKEAKEFKKLLTKLMKSYSSKDESVSDEEWLKEQFKEELDLADEEAGDMAAETVQAVDEYDANLKDLNEQCKKGTPKEQWFANKISDAASGLSVVDFGNRLHEIDTALENANAQMLRTVTTKSGDISRCMNLDGFIAEQHHVNQFNAEAALRKSNFYAEVKVPGPGETYGQNSFDVVIRDKLSKSNTPVHQYQFKFCSDAKTTIQELKDAEGRCRYNNQTIVVPTEQVEEVQKAFPGKTVTDKIGNSDKVNFGSKGLTKDEVKEFQTEAQTQGTAPRIDWNSFETKQLAMNIGKEAAVSGLYAAAITTGLSLAEQVVRGEGIDTDKTVELALKTGADAGIKSVVAGAIKIGSEKGILSIIPKGTPIGVIANIACVAIEDVKIFAKVASGELTMTQGLEQMGRTTVSMTCGLVCAAKGAAIGAGIFSFIPVVGTFVGGLAGGIVGYMAGSQFGHCVFDGAKKLVKGAVSVVSKVVDKVMDIGRAVMGIFGF